MSQKIEIFCLVRKKSIKVNRKIAEALVKMKRAQYLTAEIQPQEYQTRNMNSPAKVETAVVTQPVLTTSQPVVTETVEVEKDESDFVEGQELPRRRRGRRSNAEKAAALAAEQSEKENEQNK